MAVERARKLGDLIRSHRDYYGQYHHHKEQMAYAATTLYLGAASYVFIQGHKVWCWGSAWLVVVMLFCSFLLSFIFVCWQLRNRACAADIVMACTRISTDLLERAGKSASRGSGSKDGSCKNTTELKLPKRLEEELDAINKDRCWWSKLWGGAGASLSATVTLSAMLLWALFVFLAIK